MKDGEIDKKVVSEPISSREIFFCLSTSPDKQKKLFSAASAVSKS